MDALYSVHVHSLESSIEITNRDFPMQNPFPLNRVIYRQHLNFSALSWIIELVSIRFVSFSNA